jgi:hypothetical protein
VQRPNYMTYRASENIHLENVKMSTYRQTKAVTQKNMHGYNKLVMKMQGQLPTKPAKVVFESQAVGNVDSLNMFTFKTNFRLFTQNIEAKGLSLDMKEAMIDHYGQKHELKTDLSSHQGPGTSQKQLSYEKPSLYQRTEPFSPRSKNSNTKACFNIKDS